MSDIAAEIIQVPTETKLPTEVSFKVREVSYDGIMSEKDQKLVTGLSRQTRWRMEKEGTFPVQVKLSRQRRGRLGPEIKAWIDSLKRVGVDT